MARAQTAIRQYEHFRVPSTASLKSQTHQVDAVDNLIEAQESERARIARELHDSVGQKIALLQMSLAQIAPTLSTPESRTMLIEAQEQVSDIARELHDVSYELHPMRLSLLGLPKSIAALCRESGQQSGIDISFTGDDGAIGEVGARESLGLYRIAQEAVHNIVKHSRANRANVQLARRSGSLRLTVMDFGRGFDAGVPSKGLGLTSMRQRAQLLNGVFTMETCRSGGTRIRVDIPAAPSHH